MADVRSVITHPDFKTLNLQAQKHALSQVEPSIGSLSDEGVQHLIDRVTAETATPPPPRPPLPNMLTTEAERRQRFGLPAEENTRMGTAAHLAVSPITGLLSIPGQVYDWARRGFTNPPTGGFLTEEPITMAAGNLMGMGATLGDWQSPVTRRLEVNPPGAASKSFPSRIVRGLIPNRIKEEFGIRSAGEPAPAYMTKHTRFRSPFAPKQEVPDWLNTFRNFTYADMEKRMQSSKPRTVPPVKAPLTEPPPNDFEDFLRTYKPEGEEPSPETPPEPPPGDFYLTDQYGLPRRIPPVDKYGPPGPRNLPDPNAGFIPKNIQLTPFGGPGPEEFNPAHPDIPRGSYTPPPAAPPTFPGLPDPNAGFIPEFKMRPFGGPPPPSFNPPHPDIPRGSYTPPDVPPPAPPTFPGLPDPNAGFIPKFRMRPFGGRTEPDFTKPPARTPIRPVQPPAAGEPAPASNIPPVTAPATPPPAAATPPPATGGTGMPAGFEHPIWQKAAAEILGERLPDIQRKAIAIEKEVYKSGKSPDSITDPVERMKYSKAAGYSKAFKDKTGDLMWRFVVHQSDLRQ